MNNIWGSFLDSLTLLMFIGGCMFLFDDYFKKTINSSLKEQKRRGTTKKHYSVKDSLAAIRIYARYKPKKRITKCAQKKIDKKIV